MDDLLQEFLAETAESLRAFDRDRERLTQNPGHPDVLARLAEFARTVRGTSRFLDLPRLDALATALDTVLRQLRDGVVPASVATLAPVLDALDDVQGILRTLADAGCEPAGNDAARIARLVGLVRPDGSPPQSGDASREAPGAAMAGAVASAGPSGPVPWEAAGDPDLVPVSADLVDSLMERVRELVLVRNQLWHLFDRRREPAVSAPLERLSAATAALRRGLAQARSVPAGEAWAFLSDTVAAVAAARGMAIEFRIDGSDVEIERQVRQRLHVPLTRLVRQAAERCAAGPDARNAAGKPGQATVRLAARRMGAQLVVEVGDDGPEMADDVADEIRADVAESGGTVRVSAGSGTGTLVRLVVPMPTRIVPAVLVRSGPWRCALPQEAVVEVVALGGDGAEANVGRFEGAPILSLRGDRLPLVTLRSVLEGDAGDESGRGATAVVLRAGTLHYALAVDAVSDAAELVVEPLAAVLRNAAFLAGGAVLGDGGVAVMLDPSGIVA